MKIDLPGVFVPAFDSEMFETSSWTLKISREGKTHTPPAHGVSQLGPHVFPLSSPY